MIPTGSVLERPARPGVRSDISVPQQRVVRDPLPKRRPPRRGWLWLTVAVTIAVTGALAAALINTPEQQGSAPANAAAPAAVIKQIADIIGLDPRSIRLTGLRKSESPSGPRVTADLSGVGLAQWDARSGEVDELVLDRNLTPATGLDITRAAAQEVARKFAAAHFTGFGELRLRSVQLVDHQQFREWQVLFQARSGLAWAPRIVRIGVNASTGAIGYFWSSRLPDGVSGQPRLTAQQAIAAVLAKAPDAVVGQPTLEIVASGPGTQQLVWVTTALPKRHSKEQITAGSLIWVDANSGAVRLASSFH